MYRVELKARRLVFPFSIIRLRFLMYRVELKDASKTGGVAFIEVPNVPYGVER